MLQDHPELATWEGLKGNEGLFKTADSGDAGQILDGDPSYVTFDQTIADNLGLNLTTKYAGSEAAELTELDTAYQNQDPILMYFWTPHWAWQKYELTQVKLPKVTTSAIRSTRPARTATPTTATTRRTSCTRRSTRTCRQRHRRRSRLSAMQWGVDDQNGVAQDIYDGMDPADAAQKWIDANQAVWQSWVDAGWRAQSGASPS